MKRKLLVFIVCLLTASPVFANGAMGLGLEQWDPASWAAYVAAMIAFEAWFIGKWLKQSWGKSVTISLLANLITGFFCGISGCFAPFLHFPLVGSTADPNPLFSAFALLLAYALPSGYIEAILWQHMFRIGRDLSKSQWNVLGMVLLAHIVSIPIGLSVLLIPEHPYRGMETWAVYSRRMELWQFRKDLEVYVSERGQLPLAQTIEELLLEVPSTDDDLNPRRRRLALFTPEFRRFDTKEAERHPFVIDERLSGLKFDPEAQFETEEWAWYVRPKQVDNRWSFAWGIMVETHTGQLMRARYPEGSKAPN